SRREAGRRRHPGDPHIERAGTNPGLSEQSATLGSNFHRERFNMKRMLIIEDDQIGGHIYLRKFQAEGFQVELTEDGEAGLASTLKSRPDVVILDLMLPR